MSEDIILASIEDKFGIQRKEIDLVALTYSMGDGFSSIKDVRKLEGRGLKSIEGAGKKTGGGTRVFDAIRYSSISAIAIPGLHTESKVDPRMKVFSHLTSPEKLGIAYHIRCLGYKDFVVSDISSNTVTLAVAEGKVIGAIDACIFAPGIHHGPLDLQAIRDVDSGLQTANQAFIEAGVLKKTSYKDREELLNAAKKGENPALLALDTIALFAAMEIASMQLLLKDYGTTGEIFLAGSIAEVEYIQKKINAHLGQECICLGKWHAAIGCAEIARDVAAGKKEILGVDVDYP
jgi:putative methanogenesis marker protein 12